ncbi:MAG: type II 3-dehydroquinate dehydratase [Bacteroidota bacterium]|nr:type II 3-dehydroquinate dehydratase [Bacteroidota bacterium]
MKIIIINGPNLNLLGEREPEIYGNQTFDDYYKKMKEKYSNIEFSYFQSNSEGAIIDELHKSFDNKFDKIILNAGAYTHYSIAIRDAIKAIKTPVIEVHISNIYSREKFREKSVLSEVCLGVISGFQFYSYDLAVEYYMNKEFIENK